MKVALIDSDLLDKGTRHPNLALMKISTFAKNKKYETKLIQNYDELKSNEYFQIFLSKVFTKTKIPDWVLKLNNIKIGGTGFFLEKAEDMPYEVEHSYPDYDLYTDYVNTKLKEGYKPVRFKDYLDFSMGFTTRGCFRKCSFCVNRKYDKAQRHALVSEFYNKDRPYIYLWDDNILAYRDCEEVFEELNSYKKPFQFKQGLDIRCLTTKKAEIISKSKWYETFIFAFDHIEQKNLIIKKLEIWRTFCSKKTKLYVLCAYPKPSIEDLLTVFERIKILGAFKCYPYIMRYEGWDQTDLRGMYITIARWANQINMINKKSFLEFCEMEGPKSASMRYLKEFLNTYPDFPKEYLTMKHNYNKV